MIKKLRMKFITVSMLSITIVLFLILGTVNYTNYRDLNRRADKMLELIIKNNGRIPRPRSNDKSDAINTEFSREALFETRYFVVYFDENSKVLMSDTGNVFSVSASNAQDYALEVSDKIAKSGFIDNYKYQKCNIKGNQAIVFVDSTRDIELFQGFLLNSAYIALISLVLVFIVSYLLSPLAIKPIITAYNKQKKFITNASHEIKTPLAVISANVDIIEMSTGESKWITSTKNQIHRLADLVNQLVSLSRLDENQTMDKFKLSLSDLAVMAAESFESIALESEKEFETQIQEGVTYSGNEKNLSQLLYILLDNAFKYSNDHGKIRLSIFQKHEKMIIEVYNTTKPIAKGNHNEFFDRFYREDESHNSHITGFGIGLSLAQSIVLAHKGKITAKSIDGNSVTIEVLL
jgi:two-component system, OmpR family, sensor histidine kinase CiaH